MKDFTIGDLAQATLEEAYVVATFLNMKEGWTENTLVENYDAQLYLQATIDELQDQIDDLYFDAKQL
jgi:hypothetical protein